MKHAVKTKLDSPATPDNTIGYRQLVRDGVWLVPPDQRPPGWESLPVGEPLPSSTEKPTDTLLDSVIANTTAPALSYDVFPVLDVEQDYFEPNSDVEPPTIPVVEEAIASAVVSPVDLDEAITSIADQPVLCKCGKPLHHIGRCKGQGGKTGSKTGSKIGGKTAKTNKPKAQPPRAKTLTSNPEIQPFIPAIRREDNWDKMVAQTREIDSPIPKYDESVLAPIVAWHVAHAEIEAIHYAERADERDNRYDNEWYDSGALGCTGDYILLAHVEAKKLVDTLIDDILSYYTGLERSAPWVQEMWITFHRMLKDKLADCYLSRQELNTKIGRLESRLEAALEKGKR